MAWSPQWNPESIFCLSFLHLKLPLQKELLLLTPEVLLSTLHFPQERRSSAKWSQSKVPSTEQGNKYQCSNTSYPCSPGRTTNSLHLYTLWFSPWPWLCSHGCWGKPEPLHLVFSAWHLPSQPRAPVFLQCLDVMVNWATSAKARHTSVQREGIAGLYTWTGERHQEIFFCIFSPWNLCSPSAGCQGCLSSPSAVRQIKQQWLQLWILMCACIHSSIKLFYGDIITLNIGCIGNRELAILSGISIVK